ncbi:MAG: ACP S-malonyltransferase [Acidobacteriota bacterium]
MTITAFLFPGQGSQYTGMGKEFYGAYPEFRHVMEEADDTLKYRLSKLCFEGSEDQLKLTAITQPSILAVSIGVWEILKSRMSLPEFVAGHSMGEYSALVSAGSLAFRDAVITVKLRGEFMQEAVPHGRGAMAAIIGMKAKDVEKICQEASEGEVVSPANFNSPDQTVIAGESSAVDRAIEIAKKNNAKRALKLPVSAPFHCALMKPAQERLAQHLEGVVIGNLSFPLVSNVEAAIIFEGKKAKDSLIRQVSSPVLWESSMKVLRQQGVDVLIECGPGKVLSGLAKRIDSSFKIYHVEDESSLRETLKEMESLRI